MKEKLITFPNIITLCRGILIPFFVISLVLGRTEISVLIFGAIAIGDTLDGLSARMMNQQTRIGALFDTSVDWLVLLSALIMFITIERYITTAEIITLSIPICIGLVAKSIYVMKARKTLPTILGKITVAFAYTTTIILLLDFQFKSYFVIIMIILAYAIMIEYVIKDVKIFIEKRNS
jgi:phosphatidylglycerophosphate synthase